MATRPTVTADTDVNLDFLTKEEREALLSKKMDIIRQRNRMLNERHSMIEADRRKAEESGNSVKPVDSKTLPADVAPVKPRGRGRGHGQGQGSHKEGINNNNKPMKDRPKSHGDVSGYEPIVDVSDFSVHRMVDNRNKGKGGHDNRGHDNRGHDNRGHDNRGGHDNGGLPSSTPKNRRKPQQKQEAGSRQTAYPTVSFDFEPIVDIDQLDERFGVRPNAAPKQPDVGNNRNPPPDPSFNPLSDRRRELGERKEGGGPKKEGMDHKRHPRNYGGGGDLSKVKDSMKTMREKEKERPSTAKPLDMVMTGRERKNHEQWKQERERYDNERVQRQMIDGGNWKREWDMDKVVLEYDDASHGRKEPAKRPAGRIGSGRFDRGDSREERPRASNRDSTGSGGSSSQQHHQPQQSSPASHSHPHVQQPSSSPLLSTPQSPPPTLTQHSDAKAPRGKGRGRGRGRGRGAGVPGAGPGDKSPRPRTWSGGDDRFVECQKEMLLVKFDNTAGDNTVEVEYENGAPLSPTPSSKSSGSTPGRGPTGRTPNQAGNSGRPKAGGGKQQNSKTEKFPKGRIGSGRIPGGGGQYQTQEVRGGHPDQFTDADWDGHNTTANHRHSYDGYKVRTLSHSQSHGDSEEWEDCTGSSGVPDDDMMMDINQNLRLECPLNPDAPEFLPISPEYLKTPPGHQKVLNWQGNNSSSSPKSNPSQPSLSSPSPRQQENPHDSSFSSAESSVSTRARKNREELDTMPAADEPMPPPFLLPDDAAQLGLNNGDVSVEKEENGEEEEEEKEKEDGEERFEDSVEVAPEVDVKEKVKLADDTEPSTNHKDNLNTEETSDNTQKSLSTEDVRDTTDPQPASEDKKAEEDEASADCHDTTKSNESLTKADKEATPQPQAGDEIAETTAVSDSPATEEARSEEDTKTSSDPATPSSQDTLEEGDNPPPSNPTPDLDADSKSDKDQPAISAEDSTNTESTTDSQPTAEHSAES